MRRYPVPLLVCLALSTGVARAATHYVSSRSGADTNDGLTPATAWRSLERAGGLNYGPGDRLLLERGSAFSGTLRLSAEGAADRPVQVDAYGEGALPAIQAGAVGEALLIQDGSQIEVADLDLSSDGGTSGKPTGMPHDGVRIAAVARNVSQIRLRSLVIHDLFGNSRKGPAAGIEVETAGPHTVDHVSIESCRIARSGVFGMHFLGTAEDRLRDISAVGNQLSLLGGPGFQSRWVKGLVLRGNTVDGSGSSADSRMRGRGSGFWPGSCEDVLVEGNRFMHARGPGDSCGAHIDFGNRNVVIQDNLSWDNEGGFVEILGDTHDCCYRYNISIDDGARVKGRNGAFMDGKILWLSSFTGAHSPRRGPFDCYIYNNTIYVRPGLRAAFAFTRAARGSLIANNIFYVPGPTASVGDDQDRRTVPKGTSIEGVTFINNLYLRRSTLPPDLPLEAGQPLHDLDALTGDPRFRHPGGTAPEDYIPGEAAVVRHRGIAIAPLPGDHVEWPGGLGLRATHDFFGRPITGLPDLGAIAVP